MEDVIKETEKTEEKEKNEKIEGFFFISIKEIN